MHFIDENHLAVVLAEFILCVDKNQTFLGSHTRTDLEELAGVLLHHFVVGGIHQTLGDDFFPGNILIVTGVGLGGRSDDRLGELLVLMQTFGKLHSAYFADSRRIVAPCTACEISADNHFDTEALALHTCGSHGSDFGKLPVRNSLGGGVKEVVCDLVENLTLVGNSFGKDDVKGRDTVGGNHYQDVAVKRVDVAYLAVVHGCILSGKMEIGVSKCHCL